MTESLRHPTPELTCALGELYARLVMTEQLRRPTPELTHALGEPMYALGDAGAAAASHTGAAVHSRGCGADVRAWWWWSCYGTPHRSYRALSKMRLLCALGNTGATLASPYRSNRTCLMSELLCSLNTDNGQIFLWIGLGICLLSRGSFR